MQGGHDGYAGVAEAAGHLVHSVRPGSLVFLLSDFVGVGREQASWLAQLGAANEVVLIQVRDPLEETAPPPGLYPVTDGSRRGLLDTTNADRRAHWHQRFADHTRMLEDLARTHRAHILGLRTDAPVGLALARGLRPRRNGGGERR